MSVVSDFAPLFLAMAFLASASAFFSCAEAALFSLQADDRRQLRKGTAAQRMAVDLLQRPDRVLTAILFWNLIANIAFFAIASAIGLQLEKSERRAEAATLAVVSLLGLIVLSEMIPKTIGVQYPRVFASLLSLPLGVTVRAVDGIMPLLLAINKLMLRVVAPNFQREPSLEIADLERAITYSTEDQHLASRERSALQNIVLLSELTAEELMRPRRHFRSYRPPVDLDQLEGQLPQSGYVLVTEAENDEVASAIPLKHLTAIPRQHIEQFALPVIYVPWCALGSHVLEQLQNQQREVAAVVNEIGETMGIVTLEDMMAAIFDDASSRNARMLATASIEQIDVDRWLVTGFTNLRRLGRHFSVSLEPCLSTTVGGVLQELLQRMPNAGDEVAWSGFRLRVLSAEEQQPLRVEVTRAGDSSP